MRVLSFLTCEDVRREIDGKVTLVGVYDGLHLRDSDLRNGATVRIAAQLRVLFDDRDRLPDRVQMTIHLDDDELLAGHTEISGLTTTKPYGLNLPMALLPIDRPGVIVFTFVFSAGAAPIADPLRFTFEISADPPQAEGAGTQ